MVKFLLCILVLQVAFECNALRFDLIPNGDELEETQIEIKHGFCPRQFQRQQTCEVTCKSDANCPGALKCCSTDCGGSVCVKPDEGIQVHRNVKATTSDVVGKCPAYSTKEKASKRCRSCETSSDCSNGQLCCRVSGCNQRSCINAVKTQSHKNIKPIIENSIVYDDYSNNQANSDDYYYMKNFNMNFDQNRLSAANPITFEGPLVNIIGSAKTPFLYRQTNPFYKLEKQQYLNSQMPQFQIRTMSLKNRNQF